MDRDRFSAIAHAALDFANPLSTAAVDRALSLIPLAPGSRVLDVGCGKAELLLRLAARGCRCTGVERSPRMHAEAAACAASRGLALDLLHASAKDALTTLPPRTFDLTICIGSSHALGGLPATLAAFATLTKPGGHVLIGEGYWQRPPSREYLAALGGSEDELGTHAANVHRAVETGLTPLFAATASEADWDEYEWAYARGIEDFAAANPADPDTPAMLARSRSWRDTYLTHGRCTLGFGLYLFRTPSAT